MIIYLVSYDLSMGKQLTMLIQLDCVDLKVEKDHHGPFFRYYNKINIFGKFSVQINSVFRHVIYLSI